MICSSQSARAVRLKARCCSQRIVALRLSAISRSAIGLDIAKSVLQVHGVDNDGKVVVRRQLKRRYVLAFFEKLQPCLVGIEAFPSSHHWSRELQALGHTVRLMPPAYVKPYVKRQKIDTTDAEAIWSRTNWKSKPKPHLLDHLMSVGARYPAS
jgi:hypothetical protein